MGSPYFSASSSSGSPYFGGGGTAAATPGSPAKAKGGGGIFGKIEGEARGIIPGVAALGKAGYDDLAGNPKPIAKVGKQLAQNEAKNWTDFAYTGKPNTGVALDLLTVLSGGAGGVGKLGNVLRARGVATDLGKATDLTAPDFAARAGQQGADVVLKQSSVNPLQKVVQVGVNKGLNKLPHQTPILGSDARVVKALTKTPQRDAARVAVAAHPSTAAFDKLTFPERAAWHLSAQGVTPADYKTLLLSQKEPASAAMLKLLDHPKLADLVENPTPRLANALAEGRAASEHLTALKVGAGHVSEQAAAEAPYRLLRLVNGAKPTEAEGYVDQAGREIPVLAHELAAQGKEQPFYVPHSADTGGIRGLYTNKPPAGFSAPAASGASKQNLGILASQGRLAFNQNPIAREFMQFKNFTAAQGLHDAIVQHAAELPDGASLPHNYQFLKINRGEATAPYTQRIGGEFEHGLDPGFVGRTFTGDAKDADILKNAEGKRLVVPSSVKRIVESRQASVPHTALGLAYHHITSLWKHTVLGLRPAFFSNITVGNSILGMLQMAPGRHGFAGWLNQVAPKLEGALGKRVSVETMHDVFPEQAMGTFGHSSGFGGVGGDMRVKVGRGREVRVPGVVARGSGHVYRGVMPATIAYENVLRRAMVEGWANATPEVKAAMASYGGDVNEALRQVAKTHPQVINNISKRVDDALGDYRNYNRLERGIKNLIPFYGWDRHIVRSTARLARERPGRLNALAKVGQLGQQEDQQQLGPLPSYLQGGVKLPGLPGFMGPLAGRTPVLNAPSLNPFSTDADLAQLPGALTGNAGGTGSDTLSSGLNPIIQAAIEQATGKSLLSGAPVKGNAFANVLANMPQVALARAAAGGTAPTKPTALYRNDPWTMLAAFLGVPVKKTNLQTAHLYAAEEGKPRG